MLRRKKKLKKCFYGIITLAAVFLILFMDYGGTFRKEVKAEEEPYQYLYPPEYGARCHIGQYYFYSQRSDDIGDYRIQFCYADSYEEEGNVIADVEMYADGILTNGKKLYYFERKSDKKGGLKEINVYEKTLSNSNKPQLKTSIGLTSLKARLITVLAYYDNKLFFEVYRNKGEDDGDAYIYAYDFNKEKMADTKLQLYDSIQNGKRYYKFSNSYGRYIYYILDERGSNLDELIDSHSLISLDEKIAIYDCGENRIIKTIGGGAKYGIYSIDVIDGKAYPMFENYKFNSFKGFMCDLDGSDLKKLWNYHYPHSIATPFSVYTREYFGYYERSVDGEPEYAKYNYKTKKKQKLTNEEYLKQVYDYTGKSYSANETSSVDSSGGNADDAASANFSDEKLIQVNSGKKQQTYIVTSDVKGSYTISLKTIGEGIKELDIPASVTDEESNITYQVTGIEENAAKGHEQLETLIIHDNIKKIGAGAFQGCSSLSDITIYGNGLKKIGSDAFQEIQEGCVVKIQAKNQEHYDGLKQLLKDSGMSHVDYKYRFTE